jgi:hypothetical protein
MERNGKLGGIRAWLDRAVILLFVPTVFISLLRWAADKASPYSNYYSNTDSLGPLLWLNGTIVVSDETVWGQLVKATALPILQAISVALRLLRLNPYDFQHAIVFANVAMLFVITLLIGTRLFGSVLAGMAVMLGGVVLFTGAETASDYEVGSKILNVVMGYVPPIFAYGTWGAYRPFSGIFSVNVGVLVLALFFTRLRWTAIAVCAFLTFFHPATGGIVALLLLSVLAVVWFTNGSSRAQSLIQAGLICTPVVLMYLWARSEHLANPGPDYPWEIWWDRVSSNIGLHVRPWVIPQSVVKVLMGYSLAFAPALLLIRRGRIKPYLPYFVVLAGTALLLLLSIVSSEVLRVFQLTGFYIHKATAFAPFVTLIIYVALVINNEFDAEDRAVLYLTATALFLTNGLTGDAFAPKYDVFLATIAGWLLAASGRLRFVFAYWLAVMALIFASHIVVGDHVVGAIGLVLTLACYKGWASLRFVVPLLAVAVIGPAAIRSTEDAVALLRIARNGFVKPYPQPGALTTHTRADIFRWIRENTDPSDMILDPPLDPQIHGPSFGYDELLSLREHLMTAKESHVYVYVKSALFPAIRDFRDVYGLNDYSYMYSGSLDQGYKQIDDGRLKLLVRKHPRLKYFVREKVGSTPVSMPTVYANRDFAIHCLQCEGD